MMKKLTLWMALTVTLALTAGLHAEKIDYAKQIAPIFRANCYKCHGPDKDKGSFRLHSKAAILKGGEDGKMLEAGKPDKSELYRRISLAPDDDDIMPPKGDPLTKDQQALVKQWIAEGADFGSFTLDPNAKTEESGPSLPTVPPADEKALSKLESMNVLAMPLARNTNLLSVDFRGDAANVGDSQLLYLKPIAQQVAWLNLAGTKITDDGLSVIGEMKNLRRLHLERTGITDAGLAHLTHCADLEYLNLYGTKVTDGAMLQLAQMKGLKKIFVWQTGVSDTGVKALKQLLPTVSVENGYKPAPAPKPDVPAPAKNDKAKDAAAKPVAVINKECPVSGEDVKDGHFVIYKGQKIGFCCDKCKAKFEKNPEAYIKKLKDFKPVAVLINKECPVSGEDIKDGHFVIYKGQKIGFCCDKCKAKFEKDPEAYVKKLKDFKPEA